MCGPVVILETRDFFPSPHRLWLSQKRRSKHFRRSRFPKPGERGRLVQSRVLSGWKNIANHLGKSVRTVQGYARELDLPVRRRARKKQGPVIATKSELNAWVESRRSKRYSHFRDPSVLSARASLTHRAAEMRELAKRTRKLILGIRAARERFPDTG
jgi:hypothetical protein